MNLAAYANAELPEIATACAFGLGKAHAFVDGNKGTAFVTAVTFLRLNGHALKPDPLEGVRMIQDLASGVVSEGQCATWLRLEMKPI